MKTPGFEKTLDGICRWFKWKLAYLVYLSCAAFPIAITIACLLILAIARRSTIVLPIIMSLMLHPAIMVPFGVTIKIIEEYLSAKVFHKGSSVTMMLIRRTFTYSINIHLAMISSVLYYLYAVWIALSITSNMNFNNEPFNQCECIILGQNGQECSNKETENSFQNFFVGVPIQPFLIALFVTSIFCHMIHSLVLQFPAPISLLNYVLGVPDETIQKNEKQESESTKYSFWFKSSCFLLSIIYTAAILTSPSYSYGSFIGLGML